MPPIQVIPVEREYEKNQELRKEDVQQFRDWVDKQPHLPKVTDLELVVFLQSCYFSAERAKTAIDNYFTVRTHCPELFSNRNPDLPVIKENVNTVVHAMLRTPDGHLVGYSRLLDPDPSKFNFDAQVKTGLMMLDLMMLQEGTAPGHQIIIDMSDSVLAHLTKVSIMTIKKLLYYVQEALPVRLKAVHFLFTPSFMDKVMALMRPFLKKELLGMIHLHSKVGENLYKHVPQKSLPNELGGEAGTYRELHERLMTAFADNKQYFEEEEKRKVDETKRPGKQKSSGQLFGAEGSFKKLDID